jgi:hypothetical protein
MDKAQLVERLENEITTPRLANQGITWSYRITPVDKPGRLRVSFFAYYTARDGAIKYKEAPLYAMDGDDAKLDTMIHEATEAVLNARIYDM